jgi:hypothetical protein
VERACWKDESMCDPQKDCKVTTGMEKKFRKAFETMDNDYDNNRLPKA